MRFFLVIICLQGLLVGCTSSERAHTRTYDNGASRAKLDEAGQLMEKGKLAEALSAAKGAQELDPTWQSPYIAQADIQSKSAHFREAQEILIEGHKQLPKDVEIISRLLDETQAYLPATESEKLAREGLALDNSRPELHYFLGQAIENNNNPERIPEAIKEFEETLKLNPQMVYALIEMGKLEIVRKSPEKAQLFLESASSLLESKAKAGDVTPAGLEQWIKDRRGIAFWTAESLRLQGLTKEGDVERRYVNKLSKIASEIRTLKVRARTIPLDSDVQTRMMKINSVGARGLIKGP